MKFIKNMTFIVFLGLLIASNAWGADYAKGHGALEIFDSEGIKLAPSWVKIWIAFMALSFFSGLFFVKNHVIARWVVGGFLVGFLLTSIAPSLNIVVLSGFIGLVHIVCWSPGLFQLLRSRPFLTGELTHTAFSIWSGVITFVILFSFIFDIRDAAIYLKHILGT